MINIQDTITWIAIASAIMLSAYFLAVSMRKPKQPEYETKELLACTKCGYTVEQDFEPGDFIGMIKGRCPKCGAPMAVRAIYEVEKKNEKDLKEPGNL